MLEVNVFVLLHPTCSGALLLFGLQIERHKFITRFATSPVNMVVKSVTKDDVQGFCRALDCRRLLFGQAHHRRQGDNQQGEAGQRFSAARRISLAFVLEQAFLALLRDWQEKAAMPNVLGEHEQQVHQQRGDRGEGELAW